MVVRSEIWRGGHVVGVVVINAANWGNGMALSVRLKVRPNRSINMVSDVYIVVHV
jgi:hypothetical protein